MPINKKEITKEMIEKGYAMQDCGGTDCIGQSRGL